MKVLVMGSDSYGSWIEGAEIVSSIDEADVVVFPGGSDVNPEKYGEEKHNMTCFTDHKDTMEFRAAENAILNNKFLIGICRGAQLLTVVAGGKLVQHVNGHNQGYHKISTEDGESMDVASIHHQMMYPYTVNDYKMLAIAYPPKSNVYFKNNKQEYKMPEEPEVVWYPSIKALAIQSHPESMGKDSSFVKWLNEKIEEYAKVY